jgi:predicted TIM-barrel fold metal-dependent hydrolase
MEGIYLLNDDDSLKEEMYPILDLIAKNDAILATGHIGQKEAEAVVPAAVKSGVKRIVVTHPEAEFLKKTVKDMKVLLDLGATYLEFVYCTTTRQVQYAMTPEEFCNTMKNFEPEHVIMSTDSGQWVNPEPIQQIGMYIRDMLTFGFSERDVRTMVSENPAKLLGI